MTATHVAARLRLAIVAAGILVALVPVPASASIGRVPVTDGSVTPALIASDIQLTLLEDGLDKPIYIASAKDGTPRTFIVEKTGNNLARAVRGGK